MLLFTLFLTTLFGLETLGQTLDESSQNDSSSFTLSDKRHGGPDPNFQGLIQAMEDLSKKVSILGSRIENFEEKIHFRFQILSDVIANEKVSLENIHSRLDSLDFLSLKIEDFTSKFEDESSIIKNILSTTSNDMKRVSERLESLEKATVENQHSEPESLIKNNVKKEAFVERHTKGMKSNVTVSADGKKDIQDIHEKGGQKDTGELMLQIVENVMPRLLATELNHFYLNMAMKTDYSQKHLENLLFSELRKIESLAKNSLHEIQDGRQDMSHVTHLQRTIIDKFPRQLLRQNSSCEAEFRSALREFQENISSKIDSLKIDQNVSSNQENNDVYRAKLSTQNPYGNSGLWKGIFDPILSRTTLVNVPAGSSLFPVTNLAQKSTCLDPSASNTLQEVKQLLRTLMSKGEDLRRTLTEQANEGVDLLKHLHQRFSVLLRRINTDPKHVEALLAEVQELEHLVENSYSSILLTQNLFLESCRRGEEQELSTEGQIIDVLNKLVTNIDLGHQFNKKQLEEVRQLIEEMNKEEQSHNLTLLSSWNPLNISINQLGTDQYTKLKNINIFDKFKSSVFEANITEEKIRGVLMRIGDVEEKLQTLDLSSGNSKNVIDELLTSTKDLKNYSKDQILYLETFQNDILKFVNISQRVVVKTLSKANSKHLNTPSKVNDSHPDQLSSSCYHSLLGILNSSAILSLPNSTLFSVNNITNIFQTIIHNHNNHNQRLNASNNHNTNYDEVLMDDDYNWYNNNYYYDDNEDDGTYQPEGNVDNKKRNKTASKRYVDKIQRYTEEDQRNMNMQEVQLHSTTKEVPMHSTPQKVSLHSTPQKASLHSIPLKASLNSIPQKASLHSIPLHSTTKDVPLHSMPKDIPLYTTPQEDPLTHGENFTTSLKITNNGYQPFEKNHLKDNFSKDKMKDQTDSKRITETGRVVVSPKISDGFKFKPRNKITVLENDFHEN